MKEPVIFDIIVGLGLLCAAFGIGLRIGKSISNEQINSLQKQIDYCETKWKLDMHLFFEKEINEICEEQFKEMSC